MMGPISEDLPERDVESAAAYASGALEGEEKRLFEERMAEDPRLEQEVAAFREVISHLRGSEPQALSRDITPEVLGRLSELRRRARMRAAAAACAAGLLLVYLAGFFAFGPKELPVAPSSSVGVESSLFWLSQNQEADGSWDPGKWGGQENLRVSLTALGTLAFLRGTKKAQKPEYLETIRRALSFLLKCQEGKGRIAGEGSRGNLCQHAVATLALAEAYMQGQNWVGRGLAQALAYLQETQLPSGGWSADGDGSPSLEVTVWQLAALAWGKRAGLPVKREVLARGGRYVAACIAGGAGTRFEGIGAARSAWALGSLCLLVLKKDLPGLSAAASKTSCRGARFPWQCVLFAAVALPQAGRGGRDAAEAVPITAKERFPALAGPLSQRIIGALVEKSGGEKAA